MKAFMWLTAVALLLVAVQSLASAIRSSDRIAPEPPRSVPMPPPEPPSLPAVTPERHFLGGNVSVERVLHRDNAPTVRLRTKAELTACIVTAAYTMRGQTVRVRWEPVAIEKSEVLQPERARYLEGWESNLPVGEISLDCAEGWIGWRYQ